MYRGLVGLLCCFGACRPAKYTESQFPRSLIGRWAVWIRLTSRYLVYNSEDVPLVRRVDVRELEGVYMKNILKPPPTLGCTVSSSYQLCITRVYPPMFWSRNAPDIFSNIYLCPPCKHIASCKKLASPGHSC